VWKQSPPKAIVIDGVSPQLKAGFSRLLLVRPVTSRSLIIGLLALCPLTANGDEKSDFESLMKQASQNFATEEGRHYYAAMDDAIRLVVDKAWNTCRSSTPDTKEPTSIVFVVAADGTVRRLVYLTNIPFVTCFASSLQAIKTLPKPPRDGWVVAIAVNNHYHEEKFYAFEDWRHILENPDEAQKPFVQQATAKLKQGKVPTEKDAAHLADFVLHGSRHLTMNTGAHVAALLLLAVADPELGDKGDFVWEVRIVRGFSTVGLILVGASTGQTKFVYDPPGQ
jgi:hypothetical protein